ncbi:MAG: helix-turn-helix transcriptional regulator [Clostridia bacterium]|nr:helix-turn-helix transcriptional regulator [Clostridia bacterium]
MDKNLNNIFNRYFFNTSRSFVGAHLIGAYHTAIRAPYCNPLIHDTLWEKVNFVFIVTKGSIRFLNKQDEIKVKENQILFGETGDDIYLIDDGTDAEFFSFYFQTFHCPLPVWLPSTLPEHKMDSATFYKLIKYMRMKSNIGLGAANAKFMELLFEWLQNIHFRNADRLFHGNVILESQLYINEHVEDKLTVSELAQKYHFSEKHFRYLFTKVIGIPPKKYIENVKLEYAYGLLKTTTLTVYEISEKLGFSSVRHFVTYFKKNYQITPAKCRKKTV